MLEAGPLKERHHCEVAVVGGGVAGLLCALGLSQRGVDVCLLEAAGIAEQGSARGLGLVLPGLAEHFWTVSQSLGPETSLAWWEFAASGAAWLQQLLADYEVDCGLDRGGLMMLAGSEAEMQEMVRGARDMVERGLEPRLMSAAAATNYVPVGECSGACYFPGAATLDPRGALLGLAAALARQGRVFVHTPVLSLRHRPGAVDVVCEHGEVEAEVVALAAGWGCAKLDPALERLVFPLRGQCMVSEPVREGPRGSTPVVTCNRGHEMYRRSPSLGMLASGINPGSGFAEKTDIPEVDMVFQGFLEKLARTRFPEMNRVQVIRRWAEIHTYSADGLPLVGPLPGSARTHVVAGFASRSWSLGAAAARSMADLLTGKQVKLPPGASPRRFL